MGEIYLFAFNINRTSIWDEEQTVCLDFDRCSSKHYTEQRQCSANVKQGQHFSFRVVRQFWGTVKDQNQGYDVSTKVNFSE